jgi:hypothetical protein
MGSVPSMCGVVEIVGFEDGDREFCDPAAKVVTWIKSAAARTTADTKSFFVAFISFSLRWNWPVAAGEISESLQERIISGQIA